MHVPVPTRFVGCHEWMDLGPWSVLMMACYLDFLVGGEYNNSDKKQKKKKKNNDGSSRG